MPSLSEAPSGGEKAFCLLLRFSKVSRRKDGTLSSRYLNNGYTHKNPNSHGPSSQGYDVLRLCLQLRQNPPACAPWPWALTFAGR
jgi:hypothetical protein